MATIWCGECGKNVDGGAIHEQTDAGGNKVPSYVCPVHGLTSDTGPAR